MLRLSNGPAVLSGETDIDSNVLNIGSNVSGINSTLLNINSTLNNSTLNINSILNIHSTFNINLTLLTINNFLNISLSILKIIFPLLFILFLVPLANAKDYTLKEATMNIAIDPNGAVHVDEAISYTFDGDYNYVYRILDTSAGGTIQNINGYCSENMCNFKVEPLPEGYRLIGEFSNTTPENLTFFISYDYYGVIKVHSDVSEFHYKLWGEEWEKPLGSLKGSITFPVENKSDIRYWTHPAVYTRDVNVENNVLYLTAEEIPYNQWYEIRAVFPGITFSDSSMVQVGDAEGFEEILATENEYQRKGLRLKSLHRITRYFFLFVLIFPFLIHRIYGREPKIDYTGIYERELQSELPSDSKPAVVNAIIKGKMGVPTMDGFTATFMDLANRGYICLRNLKPEEIGSTRVPRSEPRDFIIELDNRIYSHAKGSLSELEDFEKDILYLLKDHASERKVSWRQLKKELESGTDFYQFITAWNQKVKVYTQIHRFFQSTGNICMDWFSKGILTAAIVYYIVISSYFPSGEFPLASKVNSLTILIGVFGFIMTKSSAIFLTTFGRWTPEGSIYRKRWDHFKEYLTDVSVLKERSPESITAWDSYLVYAVALGVAKQVFQNMSMVVPFDQVKESHFRPVSYNYNQFGHGFRNAYFSSYPGGGGDAGSGDVGGGFGGGGGGAD